MTIKSQHNYLKKSIDLRATSLHDDYTAASTLTTGVLKLRIPIYFSRMAPCDIWSAFFPSISFFFKLQCLCIVRIEVLIHMLFPMPVKSMYLSPPHTPSITVNSLITSQKYSVRL